MEIIKEQSKSEVFKTIEKYLAENHLSFTHYDDQRPWGGFFVIDEKEADKFILKFFPHLTRADLSISGKLSPKILLVAPNKRLSWQYHHRRAEIWKLIGGEAALATSDTDEELNYKALKIDDIVTLKQGERHRLIGLENWGVVAEIWQHTNADNPSNEDDIVRVQDDFGR